MAGLEMAQLASMVLFVVTVGTVNAKRGLCRCLGHGSEAGPGRGYRGAEPA